MMILVTVAAAGCEAHRGCGYRRRPGPLDAVALVLGVGVALAEAATREPPPPERTIVVQQAMAPAPPAEPPSRRTLHGWLIHEGLLLRARGGVTVIVSGPHGVTLRLVTTDGVLRLPVPLPDGRYHAFIEDTRFTGSSTFAIGPGDEPPLYIYATELPPP
jgi:hypothetical protein